MNRKFKKGLAIVLALVMVFAMTATAFADTTGTCSVKFYAPDSFYDDIQEVTVQVDTSALDYDATTGLYAKSYDNASLSGITGYAVELPSGFVGYLNPDLTLPYIPSLFDVMYREIGSTNVCRVDSDVQDANKDSCHTWYGADTSAYSTSGVPMHGFYFSKLFNISTYSIDSLYDTDEGFGYWYGYSWSLYDVPANTSFDPTNPNETYKSDMYPSNLEAKSGHTYYWIYELNSEEWTF